MVFQSLLTNTGSETAQSQTVNLAASSLSKVKFSPSAMTNTLIGMEVIMALTIGSGSTAGTATTVGSDIYTVKVTSGSSTTLNISGIRQVQDFYHIKTGQTLSDVILTPVASTNVTETLSFVLPFIADPTQKFVVEFDLNGYQTLSGSNATSGSMTITIRYIFGVPPDVYDAWTVVPTPSNLNSGVDVNIAQYINDARAAYSLWIDVTSDSNLSYYKFENGKEIVYDSLDATTLTSLEDYLPQYDHLSGLFNLPILVGVVIDSNANTSIKPILNLSSSLAPVIFLKVQPTASS